MAPHFHRHHAMPGTREDVIAETKLRISQLASGGGYILAPSNHLQADVPAENVVTLFQTAREFAKYPNDKHRPESSEEG